MIRVLHIDDDSEDRLLMARALAAPGWPEGAPAVAGAGSLKAGLAALAAETSDLVLLDLLLPDAQGLDAFRRLREAAPGVPVIVITGLRDDALGLEAVRRGAQDFLRKDQLEAGALRRAVCFALERARLAAARERLGRLQAEVRERRKLDRLKDRLIGTVSHELRAPLTVIAGVLDDLRLDRDRLGPEEREFLDLAVANAGRMRRFLDRLLELHRLEDSGSPHLGRVNLLGPAWEAVRGFRVVAGRRVSVEAELPAALPPVRGDEDLLAEVLNNLLANALRFARSRVLLRAEAVPGPEVHISVIDDGPGLPPGPAERLFSKLHAGERRADPGGYKGTGLGLPITREIVIRLGGRIWAEPAEGGGAAFHVALPCAAPAPAGGPA